MVGIFLSFPRQPLSPISEPASAKQAIATQNPLSPRKIEPPGATIDMLIAGVMERVQPPPVFCWAPLVTRAPRYTSIFRTRSRQYISVIEKLDAAAVDKRSVGQRIEDSALFVAFLSPAWAENEAFSDQVDRFARAHGQPTEDNTMLLETVPLGNTLLPSAIRDIAIQPYRCTYDVKAHRDSMQGHGFVPQRFVPQNQKQNVDTNVAAAVSRLILMIHAAERRELETSMQTRIEADIRAESERDSARVAALKQELPERDVFISYHSSEEKWAKWIDEVLQRAGLTTFVMLNDMKAGRSFQDVMFAAIEKAEIFLALFSPGYFSRASYCTEEYQVAVDRQKADLNRRVIGIKVADCEPPRQYTIRHHLNLHNETSAARAARQILEAVDKADIEIEVPSGWPGKS